jgi:allantoicase
MSEERGRFEDDYPDLACEDVGGAAIACNDDFFAEKENLLRAHAAVWKDEVYTDRGKWMDGWETRRRRAPEFVGHPSPDGDRDWCVVRLGMPGWIAGVVVDTAFFRGNFPESARVLAAEIRDVLDMRAVATADWVELVPRASLAGDTKNRFEVGGVKRRFTHVRLEIFPDGGVARLRVHGQVVPAWDRLTAGGGLVDLAALEHGGWVESCSDMFFGSRNNLIKPGPSRSMADGWETRRRRVPGNEWAVVRLARTGTIERLDVDTSHFKGNAPARCVVEVADAGEPWRELVASPLQPHTRHVFVDELRRVGPVDRLRISSFPCGGIARLRAYGRSAPRNSDDTSRGITQLNHLTGISRQQAFRRCCGSIGWADRMASTGTFLDEAHLLRTAEELWWTCSPDDWQHAFAAHPRIGDAAAKDAATAAWSAGEQQGAAAAEAATRAALADANRAYADRFGFIFIICATGRSADEMLAALRARLGNDVDTERRTAAEEQMKITRIRLRKLLQELA